jgi:prepilin-type processing-associated H-X9-DG protein
MRHHLMIRQRPGPARAGVRSAFTLVELLVVVGIIAMLIGLLLPALSRARANAKQVQCLSQLRQIGTAMRMHADEHNGYMPIAGQIESPGGATPAGMLDAYMKNYSYYFDGTNFRPMHIAGALAPYLGQQVRSDTTAHMQADLSTGISSKIYSCPTDPLNIISITAKSTGWSTPTEPMSYGFNEAVLGWEDANGNVNFNEYRGQLNKVRNPTQTFLMCDAIPRNADWTGGWLTFYAHVAGANMEEAFFDYNNMAGDGSSFSYTRHEGRVNFLFADAHGETLPLPQQGSSYNPNGSLSHVLLVDPF